MATSNPTETAATGHIVSTREVAALLRWLVRGNVKLIDPPGPDAAARLGRVLYLTLLNALKALREQLSEREKDALRAWCQGGAEGGQPG